MKRPARAFRNAIVPREVRRAVTWQNQCGSDVPEARVSLIGICGNLQTLVRGSAIGCAFVCARKRACVRAGRVPGTNTFAKKTSFVLVLGVETRGGTNATCQTAKNWRVLDISRLLAVDGSVFVSMLSHTIMCPGHRDKYVCNNNQRLCGIWKFQSVPGPMRVAVAPNTDALRTSPGCWRRTNRALCPC